MSPTGTTAVTSVSVHRRRSESPDETLTRYRASGLTQRAFCEQTGLPLSTLQWWLVRARRRAVAVGPVSFTKIPVPITSPTRATGWAVEIETRAGVTVRLRAPLAPAALRTLLRGGRC